VLAFPFEVVKFMALIVVLWQNLWDFSQVKYLGMLNKAISVYPEPSESLNVGEQVSGSTVVVKNIHPFHSCAVDAGSIHHSYNCLTRYIYSTATAVSGDISFHRY
jgi:hypothetical protein